MAAIDFNTMFDDEHVNSAPVDALGAPLEFTAKNLVEASKLREFSMHTIVVAICLDNLGLREPPSRNYAEWPSELFIKYCANIGALGSGNIRKEPLGEVQWDAIPELLSYEGDSLRASLLVTKSVQGAHYTDRTLVTYISKVAGTEAKNGDGTAEMLVPGVSTSLVVSTTEDGALRVAKGGEAFVTAFNMAYGANISYTRILPEARKLAFYMSSRRDIKVKADTKSIVFPTVSPSTKEARKMIAEKPIKQVEEFISAQAREAFANEATRPSMAGSSSDQLTFLEILLHNRFTFDAMSLTNAKGAVKAIETIYGEAKVKTLTALASVDPQTNQVRLPYVGDFIKGNKKIAGVSMMTQGGPATFLADSRNAVRDRVDLARKSSALDMGCIAGSVTSVPVKILRAISILDAVELPRTFQVDAFGTGEESHWQKQLESIYPPDAITYYDSDPKKIPKFGGKFVVKNVQTITPDSGKNKVIIDDTWNGPDDMPDKVDFLPKMNAIAKAGYEAGVVKVAYGLGADRNVNLRDVPQTTRALVDVGYTVMYSPGGSPQSAEYFVVFFKRSWKAPQLTETGFVDIGGPADKTDPAAFVKYHRGWLNCKAVEMISANVLLNIQLVNGVFNGEKIKPLLFYAPVQAVKLAGTITIRKDVSDAALPSAPPLADDLDMGFKF